MTSQRHQSIGIKQTIRYEWMQQTAAMVSIGHEALVIRQKLHDMLAEKTGRGGIGVRSINTRTFLVNNLMHIWVQPPDELLELRGAALNLLNDGEKASTPIHWALISAVYPFWYQVSFQVGRLLALQEEITQAQIFARMQSKYGTRQTVSRYTRYVIRSFVAWGLISDSEAPGCYRRATTIPVKDPKIVAILLEAALHAKASGKSTLKEILNSAAFFPFSFGMNFREAIPLLNKKIEIIHTGSGDELLVLHA